MNLTTKTFSLGLAYIMITTDIASIRLDITVDLFQIMIFHYIWMAILWGGRTRRAEKKGIAILFGKNNILG